MIPRAVFLELRKTCILAWGQYMARFLRRWWSPVPLRQHIISSARVHRMELQVLGSDMNAQATGCQVHMTRLQQSTRPQCLTQMSTILHSHFLKSSASISMWRTYIQLMDSYKILNDLIFSVARTIFEDLSASMLRLVGESLSVLFSNCKMQ